MKTIGDLMRDELGESDFILLRRRYRIGRRFESDLPFPKTRRADVEGLTTLGWVKIRPKT